MPSDAALINGQLDRFQEARGNARRFHPGVIGPVDPAHCLGDMLVRIKNRDARGIEKAYGPECIKTALGEASGVAGGYLIPPEMQYGIMEDVADRSIFRAHGARVFPMHSRTLSLPLPSATGLPSASGVPPFFGGLYPQFHATGTMPETEQTYQQVELTAWDLIGYAVASQVLTDDGGKPLEEWFHSIFAASIAWVEDWYFINGVGTSGGQPVGVINAGCSIAVNRQTPSAFKTADSQNMTSSLYNLAEPVWLMTRAAGSNLTAFTGWIPNGPYILQGADIIVSMKNPALGTKGDVCFVDPSFYLIGDRMQLEIEYAREVPSLFTKGQGAWRFIRRVDGQPMLSAPIDIPDAGVSGAPSTVSPFVILN